MANSKVGSYLLFSIAIIVCLVTPRISAKSSCLSFLLFRVNELGAKHGMLTIYIEDNTVTVERLSKILLDIKTIFDNAGVKFYMIDCILEYPKLEDGKRREERVEVMNFLYSDIYEEDMIDRVKAADEAAKAYYDEQDAEKLKEIQEYQK